MANGGKISLAAGDQSLIHHEIVRVSSGLRVTCFGPPKKSYEVSLLAAGEICTKCGKPIAGDGTVKEVGY